jgi:hypothetical protein
VLGQNEQIFQVSGVQAGLEAFFVLNATNGASTSMPAGVYPGYPTQKNGGSGETGAGQSTIKTSGGSDHDLEIVPSTYLLIDNSQPYALGYRSNQVTLESQQLDTFSHAGVTYTLHESSEIYAYTGLAPTSAYDGSGNPLSTTFNPADLTPLLYVDAANGVTQTVNLPLEKYLVVTADPMVSGGTYTTPVPVAQFESETGINVGGCHGSILVNDWSTCNVLVHYDVFNTAPLPGTPEPSTWAMMMVGFAGLGFAGYRKTKVARTALAA